MENKNKKGFNNFIVYFIILGYFLIVPKVFSSTLDFSNNFIKYSEGENIKVDVLVSSDVSINAISAEIIFSNDTLYLSSIERGSSVINLWVKEPTYSNGVGSINFEGIILDGFIGSRRNVITLIFNAKKEGNAILQFSKATVLANDGTGKDLLESKGVSNFVVEKIGKTSGLEESKKLPYNFIIIMICLILLTLIILFKINLKEKRKILLKNKDDYI